MDKLIKELPWDTAFFEVSIGRVIPTKLDQSQVGQLLQEAQAGGLRCLYFEANPNDPDTVTAVEQHGFQLVDVRVVLEHSFDDRPAPVPRYPVPPELVINSPQEQEMPLLQDISAEIARTSRYDFDQRFGPRISERLYRVWIKNACRGFADVVLVARWHKDSEAVGLISCTLRDGIGDIQLAGVHSKHRQRGIGTGLVQTALDWSRNRGARGMTVVTQARNVPAQRLYQQLGFFTKSMSLFYHKWL